MVQCITHTEARRSCMTMMRQSRATHMLMLQLTFCAICQLARCLAKLQNVFCPLQMAPWHCEHLEQRRLCMMNIREQGRWLDTHSKGFRQSANQRSCLESCYKAAAQARLQGDTDRVRRVTCPAAPLPCCALGCSSSSPSASRLMN